MVLQGAKSTDYSDSTAMMRSLASAIHCRRVALIANRANCTDTV